MEAVDLKRDMATRGGESDGFRLRKREVGRGRRWYS